MILRRRELYNTAVDRYKEKKKDIDRQIRTLSSFPLQCGIICPGPVLHLGSFKNIGKQKANVLIA